MAFFIFLDGHFQIPLDRLKTPNILKIRKTLLNLPHIFDLYASKTLFNSS